MARDQDCALPFSSGLRISFWKPDCEAEVNITRLQVVSAKPLMQTSGEARRGDGTATPARIKTELSQTHQNHQPDLVASKPECAQVQLHLLLPHRVLRQPNFSPSVPAWFNVPHVAGSSPMTACTVRHQLQCLGSLFSSEMSCLKAFTKFLSR